MSVYQFTYHAFGSLTPEGEQHRFVLRNQPPAKRQLPLAERYRLAIEERETFFNTDHQRKLIDIVMDFQAKESYRCFGVAADDTRVQAVVAWTTGVSSVDMRSAIWAALGRGMNREFGRQPWLCDVAIRRDGDAKRIRNRTQFDYVLDCYLPEQACQQQTGMVWTARQGFVGGLARTA
ncbi:MAG: hypothetical protein AAGF31_10600 [Planctomycetota bacterium]